MDLPVDLLARMDILQLIAIAAMLWFLNSRMDKKFDKIDGRFDRLEEKVNDIDKRVFAIETMLHMKDCCMLKDERQQLKKVE